MPIKRRLRQILYSVLSYERYRVAVIQRKLHFFMNHKIHQWVHKGSSNNNETVIIAIAVIARWQKATALFLRVWCSTFSLFRFSAQADLGTEQVALQWTSGGVFSMLSMRIQKQCFTGGRRPLFLLKILLVFLGRFLYGRTGWFNILSNAFNSIAWGNSEKKCDVQYKNDLFHKSPTLIALQKLLACAT